MKAWILIALLLGVFACSSYAKRGSISNDLFQDDQLDDEGEEPLEEEETEVTTNQHGRPNPCNRNKCHRGEICQLNDKDEAECVCRDDCERYRSDNERNKVCSSKNDTYESVCDLDRDHCLCKHGLDGCTRPGARKLILEYYGSCKAPKECEPTQMAQFPKRMRDWLFIVMEEMERRLALNEYEPLLEEARADSNHSLAVIWKFCDLDKDPQDRYVSRRELQYTVRSLRALEHCLVPFLDECDSDSNREITLEEWGTCLEVEHEKISDRCVKIHDKRKNNRSRK